MLGIKDINDAKLSTVPAFVLFDKFAQSHSVPFTHLISATTSSFCDCGACAELCSHTWSWTLQSVSLLQSLLYWVQYRYEWFLLQGLQCIRPCRSAACSIKEVTTLSPGSSCLPSQVVSHALSSCSSVQVVPRTAACASTQSCLH